MKILNLLFKSTKVHENREGILLPRLKSRGYSIQPLNQSGRRQPDRPVWLAAPAAGCSAAETPIYRGQARLASRTGPAKGG